MDDRPRASELAQQHAVQRVARLLGAMDDPNPMAAYIRGQAEQAHGELCPRQTTRQPCESVCAMDRWPEIRGPNGDIRNPADRVLCAGELAGARLSGERDVHLRSEER